MSYSKITDFASKDYLLTGNPDKIIRGVEINDELNAIQSEFANGVVSKTGNAGSAKIPAGTQAQRDVSPAIGYTRFNTTTGAFEGYNGAEWGSLGSNNGPVVDIEVYTATAGQTVFPLVNGYKPGKRQLEVFVEGVSMTLGVEYAETNYQTVTFLSPLNAGYEVKFHIWRSDTLANGDAANMSYSPAGGAAVTTTVQAKLRESVSVKDFGAKGDGVADDTAAIQAAITAAHAGGQTAGNKTVFMPAGVYLISSSIALPDYCTLIGAGAFNTIIIGSMASKSFIRSQYGESPAIGQRPTGLHLRDFSIQPASIAESSIGINFKNTQYSAVENVFIAHVDTGVVTDQITQYCNFKNVTVQVANYGALFASMGGGNRVVSCDFGGNTVPLDFNGGAWDVTGVTAEALTVGTTYCVRMGRPGGQDTLVQATGLYIEGTSATIVSVQIENSVSRSAIRMHRHSTLGTIVNNAGEQCIVEVPGQGYFNPLYRAQRVAFAGAIDGVERASLISEGGNSVAVRNAANNGYGYLYAALASLSGAPYAETGRVNVGGTTASTVGGAGGAAALPATPLGYIDVYVGNTAAKIPYYNA